MLGNAEAALDSRSQHLTWPPASGRHMRSISTPTESGLYALLEAIVLSVDFCLGEIKNLLAKCKVRIHAGAF